MPQGPVAINQIGALYAHISAATAGTLIKTGPGRLRGVNINTAGATAVLTIYDGTSTAGAVIGIYSGNAQNALDLNYIAFTSGLFVVLTAGTAPDLTITYN